MPQFPGKQFDAWPSLIRQPASREGPWTTAAQESEDKRRDRALQRVGLRFIGTDVVRNSANAAREIAEFVHTKVHEEMARQAAEAEREAE
jgi:hypothetical protein